MKLRSITLLSAFIFLLSLANLSDSQTRDARTEQHVDTTKGISLFEAGDAAAAIGTLLNSVKAHPDDAMAWHYLGRSYNRLGKNDEAIAAFQHAVKLQPTFSDSRVGLALALHRANKTSEASREAEGGLKANPDCDGCHYVLGLIALKKADQHETWRHAALALKMNPGFSSARDLRNQALVNAYSQVLNVKLKINELQTQGALLMLNWPGTGIIMDPSMATQDFRTKQGDRFDKASSLYDEALAQAPDDPEAAEWRERVSALRVWRSIVLTGEEGLKKYQILSRQELSTPPTPLNEPPYKYPDDVRQAGIKGQVVLGAVVREDGHTESIFVLEPLHALLTQEALTAARQQLFRPATKDGTQVKTLVTLKYDFGTVQK